MSIRNGGQRVIGTKLRSIQIQVPLTEAILPFWIIVFGPGEETSMCIVIIFILFFRKSNSYFVFQMHQ